MGFFHISDVICPREGIFARDRRSRANVHFRGQITQLICKNPCDNLYIACLVSIIQCFFTYSTARRRRRLSGRHMYMFSRHRKLDFCKIISFISGLECLQKLR